MSFLDRFKRKAPEPPAPEAKPEPPAAAAEPAKKADPTAIKLAAQSVIAKYKEDFKAVTKKETRLAPPTIPPPAAPAAKAEPHEMNLELGDFLHRIPKAMLAPEPADLHHLLRFKIDEMAERISRGLTTIPLVEIYRQVPNIFRSEVRDTDPTEIRFPWQKVMILLNESRGAQKGSPLSEAAARALAERLKSARPARNVIPIKQESVPPFPPPVPAPAAKTPPAPQPLPASPGPAAIPAPAATAAPAPAKLAPPVVIDAAPPASSPEDDDRLTREEIIRARDLANRNLTRLKGEYERQLTVAKDERKTLAEERDRIAAELEKAKREVHDRQEQIEFQKSVAAKNQDNLQKLQREREELLRRGPGAETQAGALALVPDGLAAEAKKNYEDEIATLQRQLTTLETAQRNRADELTQWQQRSRTLEEQLAAAERAKEDGTRKLEETTAKLREEFEAAKQQREAEAAAALKQLQEQLAAAEEARTRLTAEVEQTRLAKDGEWKTAEERLQKETARRIEETTLRLRDEFEAAKQQREAEAAAALKQLQEQLAAAEEARTRLTAEVEQTRLAKDGEWKSAEERLQKETARRIEETTLRLRDEFEAAKKQRETEAAAATKQLKDQLAAANEMGLKLTAEIEQGKRAVTEISKNTEQRLRHEHDKSVGQARANLQREFDQARHQRDAENAALVKQLQDQLQVANAAHARLSGELHQATLARSESARTTEARMKQEHAKDVERETVRLRHEFDVARKNYETESAAAIQLMRDQVQAAQETHAKLNAEIEQAKVAKIETARATATRFEREIARATEDAAGDAREKFEAEKTQRETEFAASLKQLEDRAAAAVAERDKLTTDLEQAKVAQAEAAKATEERLTREAQHRLEETGGNLRREFETAQQQRETEAAAALKQLEDRLHAAAEERNKLTAELEQAKLAQTESVKATEERLTQEARGKLEETTGNLRREFETAQQQHEAGAAAALKQLEDRLAAATAERDKLTGDLEQARLAQTESVKAAEGRLTQEAQRKLEEATGNLRREFETAQQQREAAAAAALQQLQDQHQAATEARTQLSTQLDQAQAAFTTGSKALEERLAQEAQRKLEETTGNLRREFETVQQQREAEAAAALKQLEDRLQAATEARARLSTELEQTRTAGAADTKALEELLTQDAARKVEEATARLRQETEGARQQREVEVAASLQQLEAQLKAAHEVRERISAELERAQAAGVEGAKAAEARLAAETQRQAEATTANLLAQFESEKQQRETEFNAAFKQLQEQLDAAGAARNRLAAELEQQRNAAAALQEESAQTLSRTVAGLRSEFDAAFQKRESEGQTAAQQREAELARQLEQLRGQLRTATDSQSNLRAELERAQSEQTALVAAGASATAAQSAFESRAIAQLEADNETYRTRIKAFIKERDAAKAAQETALAEARTAADKFAGERTDLETQKAELEKRLGEIDRTTSDRLAQVRKLETDIAQRTKEHQRALVAQKTQHDGALSALRAEKDAALAALTAARDVALAARAELEKQLGETTQTATERQTRIERLQAELGRAITEHSERLAHIQKLDDDIAQRVSLHQQSLTSQASQHEAGLAALRAEKDRELAALAIARDAALSAKTEVERQLGEAKGAIADRQSQIDRLRAEIAAGEAKVREKEQELARLHAQHEERHTQIGQLETTLATRAHEHQQTLSARLSEHEGVLVSLRAEKEAAVAALTAARDHVVAAKTDVEKRLAEADRIAAERQAQIDALQRAIAAVRGQVREKEDAIARLGTEQQCALDALGDSHRKALASLNSEKEAALAALRTDKEKAVAAVAAERDAERQAKADTGKLLAAAQNTIRDLGTRIQQVEADLRAAQTGIQNKEKEIARLAGTHEESFLSQTHKHNQALAALGAIRDALIGERDTAHGAKAQLEKQMAEVQRLGEERLARVEELDGFVAHARSQVRQRDETIARLTEEHQQAVAAQAHRHERAVTALSTEKEAAIAALAAEKAAFMAEHDDRLAALAAQHRDELAAAAAEKTSALRGLQTEMDRALAALGAERDKIQEAKAQADTRIGELAAERDDARKDSAAVAQRLADISIDAEKRLATIQSECDALIAAKQKAQAELLEAREAHKAQSAVFAREFKSVIGQRDQALADLTTTRTGSDEREADLAKERAALQKLEQELNLQHEREMNRLRRERDSVVQQRDALRARFERVVEEQRELLSDLHADLPGGRPDPDAAPRPARTREARKEPNVIDITEAENPRDNSAASGLNIPQARPVPMPPPNVRMR